MLFFYPKDFTVVCPTELIRFQEEIGEFEKRNVAYRGLFLIDKAGIVRHQVVNDMPLGRSIRECLRVIDALQHFEQHGDVCPVDWEKGDEAMTQDHQGVSDYLSKEP